MLIAVILAAAALVGLGLFFALRHRSRPAERARPVRIRKSEGAAPGKPVESGRTERARRDAPRRDDPEREDPERARRDDPEREPGNDSRVQVLERANRELIEHHRQSEIFLATATHELRTPLSGIVSYAEVLAEYYDTISDDERRSLCQALHQQCKAMMGLVDELFDFARLQSGRLTLEAEPIRVSELVASACDVVQLPAAERGLRIERQLADLGPVVLDPTKIRQCVLNLLSNAVKFTEPGGVIIVRLGAAAEGIEVAVTDTGPGIRPEEVGQIFEIFHSGAVRRGAKSLGLGLYLVKSFVELHGGNVWVESQPGEGSTFAFALPWTPPRASLALDTDAA